MTVEVWLQIVTAAVTALGVFLTWLVLRNQARSEDPVIAARLDPDAELPPGWHRLIVTVRNRSAYRWDGEAVRLIRPRTLRLVSEEAGSKRDGSGGGRFDLETARSLLARSAPMRLAVAAAGATSASGTYGTLDAHWEVFLLKGSGAERSFSMLVSLRSTEAKPRRITRIVRRALTPSANTETD